MAIKKIIYNGSDKWKKRASDIINALVDGGGGGGGGVPPTRKINGHTLESDINLTAEDVGAIPTTEKGSAGGVATLENDGMITRTQIPYFSVVGGRLCITYQR